jgi:glycosyltransferase involved in cell wall biosynthesis
MRVTLLAPLVAPLRAAQLGGAQAVVSDLGLGLTRAGADALVVGAPGSRLPGLRLWRAPGGPYPAEALRFGPRGERPEIAVTASMSQLAGWLGVARMLCERGGVVHGHAMDWPAFVTTGNIGLPVVHTLHLAPSGAAAAAAAAVAASARPRPWFVAPSRNVAAAWRAHLGVDAVIPNGVDPDAVPFRERPEAGLAIVAGRISPEKGTHLAVAAARRAGLRVLVAGGVYDPAYHREKVLPLLDGEQVRHLGPLPRARLLRLLGRGSVVVMASLWEEPFGMLAVESAMAGTPVACTRSGALPEIVDVRMGRVAGQASVAALATTIVEAAGLDRGAVRATAVRRFALARVVDRHLRLYRALSVHAWGSP